MKSFFSLFFFLFFLTSCSSKHSAQEHQQPKRKPSSFIPQNQQAAFVDLNRIGWSGKRNIIVLDPGHGGEDYGTNSNGSPKFYEKYLNLSTALIVKSFLEQQGYPVEMTRRDDTFISLDERADIANRLNARIFVSIHYNSAPSKDAEGLEVFFYQEKPNSHRTDQSKLLAKAALAEIIKQTGVKSRGVKAGNYAVIRETQMPAILIEGGFLTNESEMEKIKTAAYQKKMALGISRGICDYLAIAPLVDIPK